MPYLQSKLLINEYPLMVIPSLAKAIGLNEAIILQQIHYWCSKSDKIMDGRSWTYNSYPEWKKQFPWWSIDTIKRAIRKMEDDGLIISGCYNKSVLDRTKWYAIDYEKLHSFEQDDPTIGANCTDQEGSLHSPIPETSTETTTDSISSPSQANTRESQPPKAPKEPTDIHKLVEHTHTIQGLPPFLTKPRQYKAAKDILSSYPLEVAVRAADAMLRDSYWQKAKFDVVQLLNNFHKYVGRAETKAQGDLLIERQSEEAYERSMEYERQEAEKQKHLDRLRELANGHD